MSRRDSSRPGGLKWSAAVAAGGAICLSAFVASAGAPAGGAAAARPRAAQGALPDLQVSQTRLRSSLILSQRTFSANSCSLVEGCVGAAGARRTLEFDTQIMNLGNADVVLGTPASRPDLFTFSQCHGHYHMNDSLDYSLARGGTDTVGAYDAAAGTFFLNNENKAGEASLAFAYGPTGQAWVALTGDWDGDGDATPGLYDPSTGFFYLKNTSTAGAADLTFQYGPAGQGWAPLSGDWDGNGTDTVGLYDPTNGAFFLRNANTAGNADVVVGYGPAGAGWQAVRGDWDGDDDDTVGLYDPASGFFYLKNANTPGPADLTFAFGPAASGWKPIVGDWDITGADKVGLYEPTSGTYFLRNANAPGPADSVFPFGAAGAGWAPVSGDWDYNMGPALPNLGAKQAFCWIDSARVQGNNPPHYNCSNQGITAGWSDIYGRGLDCQWIDITGVAPGDYQLRVNVNDSRNISVESNYDNNTAVLKVRITPSSATVVSPEVTVRRPGNGDVFRVGEPMTIKWDVANGQDVTHQEIWLAYSKKKIKDKHSKNDANPDRQALAKIIAEGLAPGVRSFTFTPTEDFLIEGGQILVRSYDRTHLTAGDGRSKGQINIRGAR